MVLFHICYNYIFFCGVGYFPPNDSFYTTNPIAKINLSAEADEHLFSLKHFEGHILNLLSVTKIQQLI